MFEPTDHIEFAWGVPESRRFFYLDKAKLPALVQVVGDGSPQRCTEHTRLVGRGRSLPVTRLSKLYRYTGLATNACRGSIDTFGLSNLGQINTQGACNAFTVVCVRP